MNPKLMNPKHSSESVLMVVAVIAILIVACALFIAFGPASPRSQTKVGRNTVAPYDMTRKEQWLAASLTGSNSADPAAYRTDDDFQTVTMGYDLYRRGKKVPGARGMAMRLTRSTRNGLVSVLLTGNSVRYTVSSSADSVHSADGTLQLRTDLTKNGWRTDETELAGARKIRKGQKIYLKTFAAWKGTRPTIPDAASIRQKPSRAKSLDYCYLFYIQFR